MTTEERFFPTNWNQDLVVKPKVTPLATSA